MGNLGASEIFLIMLVVLLVFGAKRIPEIARGLGRGIHEFRNATREVSRELQIDDLDRPSYRPYNREHVQPRSPATAPVPHTPAAAAPPASTAAPAAQGSAPTSEDVRTPAD